MDRFYDLPFPPCHRDVRRARRRRYQALRRQLRPEVRQIVLHETQDDLPSPRLAQVAAAPLWSILCFLDAVPLVRYVALLGETTRGRSIALDARGSRRALDPMVRCALADSENPVSDTTGGTSDRTERRRARILTALEDLFLRLQDRPQVDFLVVWQIVGMPAISVTTSPGYSPQQISSNLTLFLRHGLAGLIAPDGDPTNLPRYSSRPRRPTHVPLEL